MFATYQVNGSMYELLLLLILLIFLLCFRYLIVTKCEPVSPALEMEIKAELKNEEAGIILKPKQHGEVKRDVKSEGAGIILRPKQEIVAKSAAQIVHEQHRKYVCLLSRSYIILD